MWLVSAPRRLPASIYMDLVEVLCASLPEEEPECLIEAVASRPGGRFLLASPLSDPNTLSGGALLIRRPGGVTDLLALAVAPSFRSMGLGSELLSYARRLAPNGLHAEVTYPDSPLARDILAKKPCSTDVLDDDLRRLVFYLRNDAVPVGSHAGWTRTGLVFWLPPAAA